MLAGMRAREYRSDLTSTKSGSQLAIMQERNRILEEQVRGEGRGEMQRGSVMCTSKATTCRGTGHAHMRIHDTDLN